MRKLVNTATAACGVALTIGVLASGTAAAAAPVHGHPAHGHGATAGSIKHPGGAHGTGRNHRPGSARAAGGSGTGSGGHNGGHKKGGHSGGSHHGGHSGGAHQGGHAGGHPGHPGGQGGGNRPGGGTPGGTGGADQPGGDQPGGADQPGGDQPGSGAPSTAPSGSQHPRAAAAPHIVGGKPAVKAPWAAQISWGKGGFQCTGSVIAPEWVLTARHCVDQGDMSVKVGSSALGDGEDAVVDRKVADDDGDLALLHLDHPVRAAAVTLATTAPKNGSLNLIYGFGATAPNSAPSPQLQMAKVKVTGTNCRDAFNGPAICSSGVDGSAFFGDSGGPQLADGQQVGVCSTGDPERKSQEYASVAAARPWIKKVADV